MTLLFIGLGGAAGAVLRYLATLSVARLVGTGFPYGTLAVNVLGAFAMGLAYHLLVERGPLPLAPAVTTGLLGGFTTFSAFSLETLLLIEAGRLGSALAYVGLSVLACLGALTLGLFAARAL